MFDVQINLDDLRETVCRSVVKYVSHSTLIPKSLL